jgi:hypothetical protein
MSSTVPDAGQLGVVGLLPYVITLILFCVQFVVVPLEVCVPLQVSDTAGKLPTTASQEVTVQDDVGEQTPAMHVPIPELHPGTICEAIAFGSGFPQVTAPQIELLQGALLK